MPTESDTYWSALHKALDDAKREVLETGIPALTAVQGIKPGQFVVLYGKNTNKPYTKSWHRTMVARFSENKAKKSIQTDQ